MGLCSLLERLRLHTIPLVSQAGDSRTDVSHIGRRRSATSPAISLIGSLIFAVGQLVVGGLLLAYGVREQRWRRAGVFVAMLAGAWFVWSGATELFVSGMEVAQRTVHTPSPAAFALWRGRADTLLLVVTIALALVGLAYAIALRAGLLERLGR
jgi:hypothetical protein